MKQLIITLLFLSCTASANDRDLDVFHIGDSSRADTTIILGAASYHFGEKEHEFLNEINPAIGIEAWDIQAIYVAKNSWNKPSVYLTYAPDFNVNEYLTITPQLGFASGYGCDNSVTKGNHTFVNDSCSASGIIPTYAVTFAYSPLGNNFSLDTSINHRLVMYTMAYKF